MRIHINVHPTTRIAALGIDHGIDELWTADRDFSRLPGVRVRNPLILPG